MPRPARNAKLAAALLAGAWAGAAATRRALLPRLDHAERRLREQAQRDPVTGLADRRAFDTAVDVALRRAGHPVMGRRAGDEAGVALLIIEVEDLAAVNHTHGHVEGDRVLAELARACTAAARPGDLLARIGGGELAVLAPGAGEQGAERLVFALRDAAARVHVGAHGPPLEVSVGAAFSPRDGDDRADLLRAAHAALGAARERSAAAA